jgi:DNA-directed RNA polymerase subunit RPC12/RpoP
MNNEDLVFQPAPLVCPRCNQEFDLAEGQWEYTCQTCGNPVDNMQAQFAYSRGYDAFFAGQLVFMEIPPSRRSHLAYAEQANEATQLLTEAYTAIQEAFQSNLAESQRYKAIEMMASIANLFMQTGLVSPLEANYWTSLMIEQVNRKECDELNQKLAQPTPGVFGLLKRLNMLRRRHQLERALPRLTKKINLIEQNIAFVSPPRVRKGTSGSLKAYHA